MKTVSIILNYKSHHKTIALYNQLQGLKDPNLTLFVIDNNSGKEEEDFLKDWIAEKDLFFNNSNLGYAAGNNVGITMALNQNADFIWILNPDIQLQANTLSILLKTFKKEQKIAAVGPRIIRKGTPEYIFSDGGIITYNSRCKTDHINDFRQAPKTPAIINFDVDYIDGSSILLNSKAVREIGSLPEEYFMYFEETDWCVNAKRSGWKIAVNSNATVHASCSSRGENYQFYMYRNRIRFAEKYHPSPINVKLFYVWSSIKKIIIHYSGIKKIPFLSSQLKGIYSGILGDV